MKQITVMLKPASSLCNMRCKYCFYCDVSQSRSVPSYGIMQPKTRSAVLSHIFADLERGDRLTLAFQGGEPTLAGLDFYRELVAEVDQYADRGVSVSYAMQTNGTCIDDAWCAFLSEHRFLVGLSLDGPMAYHNANRLDAQGKGTFRQVLSAKKLLEKYRIEYNVLMVLTAEAARHPQQIWSFLIEQGISFVQFIPCLGPMDSSSTAVALTPERYAGFYTAIFDKWYEFYQKGRYISIKLFDDLINLLAWGSCNACGLLGYCQSQFVVEADGSVYPCDFYVLDEYRAGCLTDRTLREIYEAPAMEAYRRRGPERLAQCEGCPYWEICGGGCKRMRKEVFSDLANGKCGHRSFLDSAISRMQEVAAIVRRNP